MKHYRLIVNLFSVVLLTLIFSGQAGAQGPINNRWTVPPNFKFSIAETYTQAGYHVPGPLDVTVVRGDSILRVGINDCPRISHMRNGTAQCATIWAVFLDDTPLVMTNESRTGGVFPGKSYLFDIKDAKYTENSTFEVQVMTIDRVVYPLLFAVDRIGIQKVGTYNPTPSAEELKLVTESTKLTHVDGGNGWRSVMFDQPKILDNWIYEIYIRSGNTFYTFHCSSGDVSGPTWFESDSQVPDGKYDLNVQYVIPTGGDMIMIEKTFPVELTTYK